MWSYAAATPTTPVLAPPAPPVVEQSSSGPLILIGGLVVLIVVVVIAISRQQANAAPLEPHIVRVTPPQTAFASALGPVHAPYPQPGPQIVVPNADCYPGMQFYPSCLFLTPRQSFTKSAQYCLEGSPYWPLCLVTQTQPLAGFRN